jgi:hypothetical protein
LILQRGKGGDDDNNKMKERSGREEGAPDANVLDSFFPPM